jgi:hypothetical protein
MRLIQNLLATLLLSTVNAFPAYNGQQTSTSNRFEKNDIVGRDLKIRLTKREDPINDCLNGRFREMTANRK